MLAFSDIIPVSDFFKAWTILSIGKVSITHDLIVERVVTVLSECAKKSSFLMILLLWLHLEAGLCSTLVGKYPS